MPHIKGNVDNGQQTAWLSVKNLDTPYPAITISNRQESGRPLPVQINASVQIDRTVQSAPSVQNLDAPGVSRVV